MNMMKGGLKHMLIATLLLSYSVFAFAQNAGTTQANKTAAVTSNSKSMLSYTIMMTDETYQYFDATKDYIGLYCSLELNHNYGNAYQNAVLYLNKMELKQGHYSITFTVPPTHDQYCGPFANLFRFVVTSVKPGQSGDVPNVAPGFYLFTIVDPDKKTPTKPNLVPFNSVDVSPF